MQIGTVEVFDGGLFLDDWKMSPQYDRVNDLPVDLPLELIGGRLGGWTLSELHELAHGAPCTCPAAALAGRTGG